MTNEERLRRARRARELLEDPIITDALAEIERRAIDDWLASPTANVAQREQLYWKAQGAREFRSALDAIVNDGALAADAIERANRKEGVA